MNEEQQHEESGPGPEHESQSKPAINAEEAEHAQQPISGSSVYRWFALIACALAAILMVAVYYLWKQQENIHAQLSAKSMAEFTAEVRAIERNNHQHIVELQNKLASYQQQQQQVLVTLQSMQQQQGQANRHGDLITAESLLRLAQNRYELLRDVATSILAMQIAEKQLQRYSQPELLQIRQQITQEMTALQSALHVDIGIYLGELEHLIKDVDDLKLLSVRPASTEAVTQPQETAAATEGWQKHWQGLLKTLQPVLTIRRNKQPATMMLSHEEERLVMLILKSRYENLRHAMMLKDAARMTVAIEQARQWIERYFDSGHERVKHAIKVLSGLQSLEMAVEYPVIGDALKQLHDYLEQSATREQVQGMQQ